MVEPSEMVSLAYVDTTFEKVACLGHGGFGSVFLAKKQSGRQVALKMMRISLDDEEDEIHDSFVREVNAVLKLDCTNIYGNKESSIVYFRDYFRGPNFACIVMPYVSGGTLAHEIESSTQPYAERRIVYYALQLSDALAHAHSKGVAHYDVKASNVLVDRKLGGKLVLSDFGSAVSPGEEGRSFTKLFAAPELQAAYDRDDFTGVQPEKVDAFALGCILFELVCSTRMVDFDGEETIGEFVMRQQSADAALNLPQISLPWLPLSEGSEPMLRNDIVGYSSELRYLIKNLLEPCSANRSTPTELRKPLRQDGSPLLADFCTAGLAAQPGAPVTIDNIQLGMFVQRGCDWNDGNADGGLGSVGVVIRLDADAVYTEVIFPSRGLAISKPLCCRIGAENRYELQVGPILMAGFVHGGDTKEIVSDGILYTQNAAKYHAGQLINPNCVVLCCQSTRIFVTQVKRTPIPSQAAPTPNVSTSIFTNSARKPLDVPMTWNLDMGMMIPLTEGAEQQLVRDLFFSIDGGMDMQWNEIICIHAVQLQPMWDSYAICCEDIATENWSNPNEKRLFHGTGNHSPESLLCNSPSSFYQNCANVIPTLGEDQNKVLFSSCALFADHYAHKSAGTKKMVLSRVALGRIRGGDIDNSLQPLSRLEYHSTSNHRVDSVSNTTDHSITNHYQAYPEFIITYRVLQRPVRRIVRASRPNGLPRNEANRYIPARPTQITSPVIATNEEIENKLGEKQCVVCLERPVSVVLIPCGHPCLCKICSTKKGLRKLKMKCPECRTKIIIANKFYGTIIE